MTRKAQNTSTRCNSGPYCYLLNFLTFGAARLNGPKVKPDHSTWQDAARCERDCNAPHNNRPTADRTALA